MELTDRQILLINLLMNESETKPVKHFAKKLNVSTRTIYSDLDKIKLFVQKLGFDIEKKRGLGVKLDWNQQKMKPNHMNKLAPKVLFGVKERKIEILERLLFDGETVTLNSLADSFFVSKSSIHADLLFIKEHFLNQSTVKLVSDMNGTRIEGSEEAFQNTLVLFNALLGEYEEKKVAFSDEKDQKYSFLKKYYGDKLVQICQSTLYEFVKNKLEMIADYYIYNILSIVIVLAYRSSLGFHIDEVKESTGNHLTNTNSNLLLDQISSATGIKFTKGDAAYLNKHMAANKMSLGEINVDFKPIIDKVLTKLSKTLKVDVTKDAKLSNQLAKHFPSMIYRLKNRFSVQNPFITQIKHEFGLMYNITWFVMSDFEDELQVNFTDNEIGFLMIYFQSTLDRMQLSKRVLIICPTGITTSGLLLNRVRKILPPLDLIEIASFDEMSKINLDEIDFIISTAHIKVEDTPVIVVSPLISNQDMQNILKFYNSNFVLKEDKRSEEKEVNDCLDKINKYMNKNFIEFGSEYESAEEMINDVTNRLYTEGYILKDYKESLLDRIKSGDIVLPTGVAVPHGNPQYVKKTVLVLCVNNKPMKWNDQHIRIVIFLCISKDDLQHVKEILGAIYSLIEDKETVEKVFIHSNKEEFIKLLGGDAS